jgi:MtN3 and saliva related transmembrane protein
MADFFSNPVFIGTAAGVLTGTSMLPQLIKIVKEKKAEDISIIMLIILVCGLALWIRYGIIRKDLPVILTNAFSLLVNMAIIFFSLVYKKTQRKSR